MRRSPIQLFLCCLLLAIAGAAPAVDEEELLQPEQAFQLSYAVKMPTTLVLSWDIADGYYLYRHKFKFDSQTSDIEAGTPPFPDGQSKQDQFFGHVEIYRKHLAIELPLRRTDPAPARFRLEVTYQGCADAGVCYLPVHQIITLDMSDAGSAGYIGGEGPKNGPPFISEQERIAASLSRESIGWIVLSFIGFGLLLSFTPCVFPMIPVISGIIAGHGSALSTRRAFVLSLSYVLASSLTYTVFGVMAGLFGNNLQIMFQQPWAITAFSGVFVLLALSVFGVFRFQLPSRLQSTLMAISSRQKGGSIAGAAVMGLLSALAIGPCVTAPLTGILIYIGQSGDAVLGGVALFALGIGMGIPLLIVGTSTRKLLPKTGPWMQMTKAIFGTGLLLVAAWLMSRIMPLPFSLLLGGLLMLIPLRYLGWHRARMALGLTVLIVAMVLTAGTVSQRQNDYTQLFCSVANACADQPELPFKPAGNLTELRQMLADAHQQGQWLMLEFYADWCVTCQELKYTTFADAKVRAALSNFSLVQADVTQDNAASRAMLQHFALIGPPAILFFGPDQLERKGYRIVGFIGSEELLAQFRRMIK